jgi:hypothetical protein
METPKNMKKKPKHGGKRPGSGRPAKEPTTTIRVPESLVGEIRELIEVKKGHRNRVFCLPGGKRL